MTIEVRPLQRDEYEAAGRMMAAAFLGDYDAETYARDLAVFEFDRSLAAFDGATVVATAGAWSMELTVPGGALPTAGTTWVGVAATHRRRGLMRTLLTRHLADVHDRGEPLAALWASEALLYRRFGYGLGCETLRLEVASRPAPPFAASARVAAGTFEEVPLAEAVALIAPVYAAARRRRPGVHARSDAWWGFQVLGDPKEHRNGFSAKRVSVLRAPSGEAGAYAVHRVKERWSRGALPQGQVEVLELAGVDGPSEAALWRYLLDTDLASLLLAHHRPVDDPLPLLLADSRAAQRSVGDALWVRAVDVPAALSGRRYAAPLDLAIRVVDEVCPWNAGTWRLQGAEDGASCTATEAAPDLVASAESIGALVLGGTSATALADAGLLVEERPGAAAALARATRSPVAPWAPETF